jgi:hypothetical protein
LIWAYYEQVVGEVPFPSWADAAFLSLIPWAAVALLLFPSARTWRGNSRLVLDGLIVTGSLFLISWLTVMRPIWRAEGGDRLRFALELAYPAGDVLIVALGLFVLVKAPAGLRTTLTLLVAGLACSAVGNGVWAYVGDPVEYKNGGVADISTPPTSCWSGLRSSRASTRGRVRSPRRTRRGRFRCGCRWSPSRSPRCSRPLRHRTR